MSPPRRGFLGRKGWVWTFIASWFVPIIMSCAYVVFALLSQAKPDGWAWLGGGLCCVFALWWVFRQLTQNAAIARASAVGDAELILEIAGHALTGPFVRNRAELVIYQAVAHELLGDWDDALRSLATTNVPAGKRRLRALAASVKVTALVETGDVAQARALLDAELAPLAATLNPRLDALIASRAELARGRVLVAEHAADARAVLQQVIDDVRAGAATRDRARELVQRASV